ncbi:MAG: alanine racemase, partial [Gemmatimonadota bacterium]|nr:alanine racemase [Gemmatimonadota bacterium]
MQPSEMRAWVDIDLGALQRNAVAVVDRARAPLLPMIKADAYGLGAIPVARVLEPLDPWGYGVATVREGLELRAAGIARPIVIFTPLSIEELSDVRAAELTPSLARAEDIARWHADGGGAWHLAIDTGMSRAGIRWDEVDRLRKAIGQCPPEGAYTHFHSAELNDGSRRAMAAEFSACNRRGRSGSIAIASRKRVSCSSSESSLSSAEWKCV